MQTAKQNGIKWLQDGISRKYPGKYFGFDYDGDDAPNVEGKEDAPPAKSNEEAATKPVPVMLSPSKKSDLQAQNFNPMAAAPSRQVRLLGSKHNSANALFRLF